MKVKYFGRDRKTMLPSLSAFLLLAIPVTLREILPITLMLALSISAINSMAMAAEPIFPQTKQSQGSQLQSVQDANEAPAFSEKLNWQSDFNSALAEAKSTKKLVLVDVYTDWCVYCKKMDREVYSVPSIDAYMNEKFVLVKVNAEDNSAGQALADQFDAHSYPTVLVFDSRFAKQKPQARISGYLSPAEFNTALHSIVESKKYKPKRHK